MKKRVIIFLCLLGVVGVCLLYMHLTAFSVIDEELNRRAEEYIESQKKSDPERWLHLSLDEKDSEPTTANRKTISNDCLTYTLPFSLLKVNSQQECMDYVTFSSPRGTMKIYQQEAVTPDLISQIQGGNYYIFKKLEQNKKKLFGA